ncbi:MAG TPA: hypothetical protein VGP12_08725, partial [Nitrosospira sp.]|nr:hypothetical protein [Nitrosospira sp.]
MRSLAILRLSVLSPIFWATFILSFTYGLNARFGTAGGAFWDVVLRVHLSSTIFALVVLPLWMALAVFITRPLREEGALIRYGSFQSAWWWGARQLSARWLGLAVARIFGLYVSAVGLPLASTVIDPGVVGSVTAHGLNPVWVLGGQIVLETAFALTIALVLNTLTVLGASIYVQVITAMAFFGWFLAGASGALSVDSIFNLARFVQVQFLLTDPRTALLVLVASLGIVVALSLLARAKDMAIRLSSASPWANAITIHWLLGALLLAVLISQNLDTALEENLITVMSGNAGSTMNALTWSFIYCGLCGAWVVSRMPNSRQLLSL